MKKITVFIAVLIFTVSVLFFRTQKYYVPSEEISIANNAVPTDNVLSVNISPTQVPVFGTPAVLSIPKIGVQATVESVGLDKNGNMDVPKKNANVAWYSMGFKPGEKGNTVLAGHYDTMSGEPAVFWRLEQLVTGDQVIVSDSDGNVLTFNVVAKESYPYNNFPINKVFGAANLPYLNLITCGGTWNTSVQSYSSRIVVYTQLVK